MIATFNPQTAADRKNYRDVTIPDAAVPETVRAMAEAIKSGWSNGKLSSGPYPNQGKCLTGIFRSSPWLRRTIKCPNVEASTSGRALA